MFFIDSSLPLLREKVMEQIVLGYVAQMLPSIITYIGIAQNFRLTGVKFISVCKLYFKVLFLLMPLEYISALQHQISSRTADKYLMRILVAGETKAQTRKWLRPDAPTLEDCLKIVFEIYKMGRDFL